MVVVVCSHESDQLPTAQQQRAGAETLPSVSITLPFVETQGPIRVDEVNWGRSPQPSKGLGSAQWQFTSQTQQPGINLQAGGDNQARVSVTLPLIKTNPHSSQTITVHTAQPRVNGGYQGGGQPLHQGQFVSQGQYALQGQVNRQNQSPAYQHPITQQVWTSPHTTTIRPPSVQITPRAHQPARPQPTTSNVPSVNCDGIRYSDYSCVISLPNVNKSYVHYKI